jgi:hypothetical protein
LTNGNEYPEKVRKKPLLTPEELDRFLDNYLQKATNRKGRSDFFK